MKRIISCPGAVLFYVSFSSRLISWAQVQKPANGWTELNLKGSVKSIREHTYDAVNINGGIQKGKITPDSSIFSFDSKGYFIEKRRYANEHCKGNGGIICRYDYEYGSNGKIIGINRTDSIRFHPGIRSAFAYATERSGKKISTEDIESMFRDHILSRSICKYATNGNPVEETEYGENDTIGVKHILKYDDNGKLSEENCYDQSGTILYKDTYKYDKNGDKTEESRYKDGKTLWWKSTVIHNSDGNMVETNSSYNPDGSIIDKNTIMYGNKGNIIEKNVFTPDGIPHEKHTYKYEANGNIIVNYSPASWGAF